MCLCVVPWCCVVLFCVHSVIVTATKDGVKFTTSGDVGTANITVRQNATADKVGVVGASGDVLQTFSLVCLTKGAWQS